MRAFSRLFLVAAALVFGSTGALSAAPVQNVDELAAKLEQLRVDVKIPAFSAAIAKGDRVVWAKGFGLADIEANVPATANTNYHLASLTKTFASTIIMQLAETGQIDLDAPVSKYGVKIDDDAGVCVKHLLSHTSNGTPGARYGYDGNRFALLTQVVENASGRAFGQLLQDRIIGPLGLAHTAPNVQDGEFAVSGLDRAAFEKNLARGYELTKDGKFKPVEYPKHFNCSAGLISTAPDVARYSIALDQGRLLSPTSLERAMSRYQTNDGRQAPYGLGWFVIERDGVKVVWHYGLWVGNSSLIVKVPARQITFVVLANSERLTSSYFHGRGELITSPFARTFIEGFVTGAGRLPEVAIAE